LNLHQNSAKLVEILNIPLQIVNALSQGQPFRFSFFSIGVRGCAERVAVFGADKRFMVPLLPKHGVIEAEELLFEEGRLIFSHVEIKNSAVDVGVISQKGTRND